MSTPLWTLPALIAATGATFDEISLARSGASPAPHRGAEPLELPSSWKQKEGGREGHVPPAGRGTGPVASEMRQQSPREAVTITGVSIDTRTLAPGDLFVALKDARDGHDFVTTAFKNGAAAALVTIAYARHSDDGLLLRVDDPLRALESLARAARARLSDDARVIAVTGSAGKTTTKEMLRACLTPLGPTHASEKSYNNHWGVPLTLARMPAGTRYAILEIGMNHPGEITPLTKMARPHVAIVTTVGAAHLEHFGTVEKIAEAKAEIFAGLEPGGTKIILDDNAHFAGFSERASTARVRRFGRKAGSDAHIIGSSALAVPLKPQSVTIRIEPRWFTVRLASLGLHMAHNAAIVALVVDTIVGPKDDEHPEREKLWDQAQHALNDWQPEAGRGNRMILRAPEGEIHLIDESYNANPLSMNAAIGAAVDARSQVSTFEQRSRLVLVLGDMLELGADAPQLHRDIAMTLSHVASVLVLTCGPLMHHLHDALPENVRGRHAASSAGLEQPLLALVQPGDVVMIKGSNGMQMNLLVEALLNHFPPKSPDIG